MSKEISKNDNINKRAIYIKGCIIGVIISVICMLLFSAVLLFLNLSRAYAQPFATVSIALGCFWAAYYTAKKIGDRGYIIGFVIGIAVFLLITVLSIMIKRTGLNLNTLFHFIIITLYSLVGGIVGVNRDKSKKYI